MFRSKKWIALVAGMTASLSAAGFAQLPSTAQDSGNTLVVPEATVDWILKSDVSAFTDGVVEKLELDLGKVADRQGAVIGFLHKRRAELIKAKADIAASSKGALAKAKAQVDVAASIVETNQRMVRQQPGSVPREEQMKSLAELAVAKALEIEANENLDLARAEAALAEQQLEEHTIRAPFPGVIVERLKGPGESVRSGDPIVRMGNLDRLRAFAYIPLEYKSRVKVGAPVLIRGRSSASGADASDEIAPVQGEISFVDPQVQAVSETAIRIYADFNNSKHQISPGIKVELVISLDGAPLGGVAAAAPGATLPEAPPVRSAGPASASNAPDLPELPPAVPR
jgi:multidrug resistance efflux pump